MTVEIECHFLLRHGGWRNRAPAPQTLYQGYVSVEKEHTIRVCIVGDRAWLTLKSYISDLSRNEFEYEIPPGHARQMIDGMCPFKVEERRYRAFYDGFVFEIDGYGGSSAPLIVAEIELPPKDAWFEKPDWLGEEITSDGRLTNAYLSKHPYPTWER